MYTPHRYPLVFVCLLMTSASCGGGGDGKDGGSAGAPAPDAGNETDGAVDVDAATGVDGGAAADAGTPVDAGGGVDAAAGIDAAMNVDGGSDASTGPKMHVLISELSISPGEAEYFEIWNPNDVAVALDDHHVADNSVYHTLTGGPWAPAGTPGTDFLVRFPAGTTIAADAVLTVALHEDFESLTGTCPDFIINSTAASITCDSTQVPAMKIPTNASAGNQAGLLLSNADEMLILFTWTGDSGDSVLDVDYLAWGDSNDPDTRVDKTGVSGYADDTAPAVQLWAEPPADGESVERCDADEPDEAMTAGNGATGHDETSEALSTSFVKTSTPSPGVKNGCL